MSLDYGLESDEVRHIKNILDCHHTSRFAKSDFEGGTLCTYLPTIFCRHRETKKVDCGNEYYCGKWKKKVPYDKGW